MENNLKASCFCGGVELDIEGEPEAMGYCHCDSCRHWSAGPVNAFSLWEPSRVKVLKGEKNLRVYAKTEKSLRKWCSDCGGHVMTEHPSMGLIDVYSAVFKDLDFKPSVHVFYGEKVISMKDGLPKMNDLPSDMGGTGDTLAE